MTANSAPVPIAEADLPVLDLRGEELASCPEHALMKLMGRSKLAISERGVEVLSYELASELYNDRRMRPLPWEYFAEQEQLPEIVVEFTKEHLLHMSADKHLRVRRILVQAFTQEKIAALRPVMVERAVALVDKIVEKGGGDLTAEFTHYYTIEVLRSLIGVPHDDVDVFGDATVEMMLLLHLPFEGRNERLVAAVETLGTYVRALIDEKRELPTDDFIGLLANETTADDQLSDDEIAWAVANLLFAGHDTTRYQLASCIRAAIEEGLWEKLREDPALIPPFVEEALRRYTVVGYNTRELQTDIELEGVLIPKGTILVLNMLGAVLDEDRFEHPMCFDVSRAAGGRRVPFGHGLHKCLGHALARQGMEVGLEVLTQQMPNVALDGEMVLMPANGNAQGPKSLPIKVIA